MDGLAIGRIRLSWVLQLIGSVAFAALGGAHLASFDKFVQVYDEVGLGQWLRMVAGLVYVCGAISLLIPKACRYGAALLAATMCVVVLTDVLIIAADPTPAVVLLALCASILWLRRGSAVASVSVRTL